MQHLIPPAAASATPTPPPRMGILPRIRTFFLGERAARLTEQTEHAHWLSYLLVVAQSIAVLLVFGHAEVGLLFAPNVVLRLMAAAVLFLLVATVIAADWAMLASMRRVAPLRRNRQTGMLVEHLAYILFVFAVEGVTYGAVLVAIDSDPQILIENRSLIPTTGPLFLSVVIMRVVLICWSAIQLLISKSKLPVLLSTLVGTGKELVGGSLEQELAALNVKGVRLVDLFLVYARMARPPRRVPGFWNRWLVVRELAAEAEEERQVTNVMEALRDLERHRLLAATAAAAPAPAAMLGTMTDTLSSLPIVSNMPAQPLTALPAPDTTPAGSTNGDDGPRPKPPTGPGSPTAKPARTRAKGSGDADTVSTITPVRTGGSRPSKVVDWPTRETSPQTERPSRRTAVQAAVEALSEPAGRGEGKGKRGVRTPKSTTTAAASATAPSKVQLSKQEQAELRTKRKALITSWLDEDPEIKTREMLRRLVEIEEGQVPEQVSVTTVNHLRQVIEAERSGTLVVAQTEGEAEALAR